MKYLKYTLALLIIAFISSCGDGALNPIDTNSGGEDGPSVGKAETFGLVEVTISGIGTDQMTATAQPYRPGGSGIKNVAGSISQPSGSNDPNGEGTIQMEPISNGSFTTGTRGTDGWRYLYATFKVRNATENSIAYNTPRENLTFMAVDNNSTFAHTAISELTLFDGSSLTGITAENIAKKMIPTAAVYRKSNGELKPKFVDVLQVYSQNKVSQILAPSGTDVFPYGFITRSPDFSPGSRTLPPNPLSGLYAGVVTFAFKIPLRAQANQDPFEITAVFLPVDDSHTYMTQAIEEQSPEGLSMFKARVAELNPGFDFITIFPGSTYRGFSNLLCGPVRVAGTAANPTPLFPVTPTISVRVPDPYSSGSVGVTEPATFTASFNQVINGAGDRSFTVHGRQSGKRFIGQAYSGNGTSQITSPQGDFFAGETVEVSLTPGLGICPGNVARYRMGVTAGSGTFSAVTGSPFGSTFSSNSIVSGDLNGDGKLDLAMADRDNDKIVIFQNNGSGGFSITSSVSVDDSPASIELGDLDGDGDLDMAVAFNHRDIVGVLLGDGNGGFSKAPDSPYSVGNWQASVAMGDLDGDGDLDIVAPSTGSRINILLNNGSAGFRTNIIYLDGGESIALGDLDEDGDLDMVIPNTGDSQLNIHLGDGDGGFTEASYSPITATSPGEVVLGDIDNNGSLDIVTLNTTSNSEVNILRADPMGGFTSQTFTVTTASQTVNLYSVALGDLDNDGKLDMVVTADPSGTTAPGVVNVLMNHGNGNFAMPIVYQTGEIRPSSVTLGDFDDNGSLDIAAEHSGTASVLLNQ